MNVTLKEWLMLGGFIAVCFLAAAVGGKFTSMSVGDWYVTLRKPSWNPPSWIFGPVWTLLYLMMAVAAWLVWRQAGFAGGAVALTLLSTQLALNVAWSWFFFAQRNPRAGFFEIVALEIFIAATALAFARIRPLAGILLIPYLLWVTFASALNFVLWRMNP